MKKVISPKGMRWVRLCIVLLSINREMLKARESGSENIDVRPFRGGDDEFYSAIFEIGCWGGGRCRCVG